MECSLESSRDFTKFEVFLGRHNAQFGVRQNHGSEHVLDVRRNRGINKNGSSQLGCGHAGLHGKGKQVDRFISMRSQ
jgi:hypothetical protein